MRALFGFAMFLATVHLDIDVELWAIMAVMCYATALDVWYLLARWRETR